MPRASRTLRRLARPAVAVVLVFAQAVAAFGFPAVRSKGQGVRPCGCTVVCGTTPDCCCTKPAPPPPPPHVPACPRCVAEPEPEPPACPKCKAKESPKPACGTCATTPPAAPPPDGVTWVASWKARQCRGEAPGGLLAELPAIPPAFPVAVSVLPSPITFTPPADSGVPHFVTDPSDPPPRR